MRELHNTQYRTEEANSELVLSAETVARWEEDHEIRLVARWASTPDYFAYCDERDSEETVMQVASY